ncbi:MAG: dipeptide epimerase [Bacteroidota bacterium]|jgi:L-alanine-DL-glutamate epimerase-like enolase superfamily enzyme
MNQDRREFLKTTSILAGASLLNPFSSVPAGQAYVPQQKNPRMKLRYRSYTLELRHVFTIATSSRTTTPVMLTEIEYDGVIGYGEASMPPYLGESQEGAAAFLSKINIEKYDNPFEMETILNDIDIIATGNPAAKAAVDIALHDLVGKLMNQPWYNIWGFKKSATPYTSFTIGIDKEDVVRQKTKEAAEYKVLKVKLGRDTDKMMIETIRSVTDKPITVDVNQGWKDRSFALDMIHWLKEKGVVFVEQPMPKEQIEDMAWLTERSPLPTFGDEGVQRLADVKKAHGVYNGINIKLMKSTGMREAHKMLMLARALDMKVMVGCMTETSCGISAASHLSPMVDYADLDGALLISNDPYDGTKIVDGKVTLTDRPGIGVKKLQ